MAGQFATGCEVPKDPVPIPSEMSPVCPAWNEKWAGDIVFLAGLDIVGTPGAYVVYGDKRRLSHSDYESSRIAREADRVQFGSQGKSLNLFPGFHIVHFEAVTGRDDGKRTTRSKGDRSHPLAVVVRTSQLLPLERSH